MFSDKFVVALKVDGKVLREKGSSVQIPFNTEYSILLKNLESKKAVVKISVDGEDVLDSNKLIVFPNAEIELDGYMKDSIAKNRFKFIEKTKQIEEYRGNRVDDSLIRVEFWFEQDEPIVTHTYNHHHNYNQYDYYYPWYIYHGYPWGVWHPNGGTVTYTSSDGSGFNNGNKSITLPNEDFGNFDDNGFNNGNNPITVNNMSFTENSVSSVFSADNLTLGNTNEDGITVKGTEINQEFNRGYTRELESQSHVITLKIKGFVSDKKKVKAPLFVNDKPICGTCGEKNDSTHKYCKNCGTFLE